MKSIAIIPARFGSTRLPGKPLLPVGGVPLVVRVAKGVSRSSKVERIVVATDDERIAAVAKLGGFEAIITPKDLHSGSDRVAYVAKELQGWDIVLNVQVDDALVGPDMIDPLVDVLKSDSSVQVALLVKEIEKKREVENPNVVKVVFHGTGGPYISAALPCPTSGIPRRLTTSTSVPMPTGGISCSSSPNVRRRPSSTPRAWRCCAYSRWAMRYAASRRGVTR